MSPARGKLVFVHGSGAMKEVWHYQTKYFSDSHALTLPGHGQGKPCPSVAACVEWVRGYLAGKGYRDVVLAGHSLGGAIVLLYALEYPEELKAIIPVATGARLRVHPMYVQELEEAVKGNLVPWQKRMEERYALVEPRLRDDLLRRHWKIGPAAQLNDLLSCDKFDVMPRLGEIKLPTLVLVGTEDTMTPVKYADYLARSIPGAREVVIPGTTHHLFLEKPKEFNQAVEGFLAGLS